MKYSKQFNEAYGIPYMQKILNEYKLIGKDPYIVASDQSIPMPVRAYFRFAYPM